jgi:hypothetical protein
MQQSPSELQVLTEKTGGNNFPLIQRSFFTSQAIEPFDVETAERIHRLT